MDARFGRKRDLAVNAPERYITTETREEPIPVWESREETILPKK
jgi:hypothetical protein